MTRDAKVKNGIVETKGEQQILRKRPGTRNLGLCHAGVAQLLYSWNGLQVITGDVLSNGTLSTIISAPAQDSLTPTVAGLQFSAQETSSDAATPRMMFKNRTQAWTVNRGGVVSLVTLPDTMGAQTYSVVSLTRSVNTATASFVTDPGLGVGDPVAIAGAVEGAYNGLQTITAVTPGSFSPERVIAIASITRSGTTATAITAEPHGLTTATAYLIAGANETAYNGAKTITVVDATTFTYTVTVTTFAAITGTWNPADKSSSTALSGANLIANMNPADGVWGGVRSTVSKSATQWAWEITVGNVGRSLVIGIATSGFSLSTSPGASAVAWGYYASGVMFHNSISTVAPSYSAGDKIGVIFDGDADTVAFYKNGVLAGSYTGVSGAVFPLASNFGQTGTPAATVTANFAGVFTYNYDSPPTPATGTITITDPAVTVTPTISYTVGGAPSTPATGTITATGAGGMVPGIAYINGYFCIMDTNGVIWNSASDDPTTWDPLDFNSALSENGAGKAIAKSGNFLIAFKEWSTEPFFDAQTAPPGSPFAPVDNAFTQIGCASGDSVCNLDGALYWVSQTRSQGRGVYRMVGLQQEKVSTPDIERVLNADDLAYVRVLPLKLDGHSIYILTLGTSDISLAYDATSNTWSEWSSQYVSGAAATITSITYADGIATATCATPHGLADGDSVFVGGADQAAYNGAHQTIYVSATVFTFEVDGTPATPATGAMAAFFVTESAFVFSHYVDFNGTNLLLHVVSGHLYTLSSTAYMDDGDQINLHVRTVRMDGGSNARKKMPRVGVIGDALDDTVLVRWSDDDCATFSPYRLVDMSGVRPELRRCGPFRRRTIELRYAGNNPIQLSALELEIAQ